MKKIYALKLWPSFVDKISDGKILLFSDVDQQPCIKIPNEINKAAKKPQVDNCTNHGKKI